MKHTRKMRGAKADTKAPGKCPTFIEEKGQLSLPLYHAPEPGTTVDNPPGVIAVQMLLPAFASQQLFSAKEIEAAIARLVRKNLQTVAHNFENRNIREACAQTDQRHLKMDMLMKQTFALPS